MNEYDDSKLNFSTILEHLQHVSPRRGLMVDVSQWRIQADHFIKAITNQPFQTKLKGVTLLRVNLSTYAGLRAFLQETFKTSNPYSNSQFRLFNNRFMLFDNMHASPNPKQFLTLWINYKP